MVLYYTLNWKAAWLLWICSLCSFINATLLFLLVWYVCMFCLHNLCICKNLVVSCRNYLKCDMSYMVTKVSFLQFQVTWQVSRNAIFPQDFSFFIFFLDSSSSHPLLYLGNIWIAVLFSSPNVLTSLTHSTVPPPLHWCWSARLDHSRVVSCCFRDIWGGLFENAVSIWTMRMMKNATRF